MGCSSSRSNSSSSYTKATHDYVFNGTERVVGGGWREDEVVQIEGRS